MTDIIISAVLGVLIANVMVLTIATCQVMGVCSEPDIRGISAAISRNYTCMVSVVKLKSCER